MSNLPDDKPQPSTPGQDPAWSESVQPPPNPDPAGAAVPPLDHSQTISPEGDFSRRSSPPALDEYGLPLPRRVDEIDMNATRVTPAAYQTKAPVRPPSQMPPPAVAPIQNAAPATPAQTRPPGVEKTPSRPQNAANLPARPPSHFDGKKSLGCFLRGLAALAFVFAAVAVVGATIFIYMYASIASTLPSVDDLSSHTSQFETTRIFDRNGRLLYELNDPNQGKRIYVTLDEISPELVAATIATEDKNFYTNPGVDFIAILRAFWQNYQSGETVSGASTITQQLARILLFTPEERVEQSYTRKLREAMLAAEITRRYSKDEILELYLNEAYYGNLSYGIEAAAETYFNTTADKLDLAQSSFLAGLPQSPAIYDVYTQREITLERHKQVLLLMYEASKSQGCIYVSNSEEKVCVSAPDAVAASQQIEAYNFPTPTAFSVYPHWVQYVRGLLEEKYGAQAIYRSGFQVYTTLDSTLQDQAQALVTQQVANLAAQNVKNGALVSIKPSTGEILAMVGSPDYYNEANSGQVNMATSPTRQPGSSIKPITYVASFEKGWTPGTLMWDVPIELPPSGDPNDPSPRYVPQNYDGKFHGAMTIRTALANSFNIPAVRTLNYVGIYDDPNTPQKDGMIGMAERLGITTFTRPDYGLSLTLGGGEVSLLEMTGAFSVFANGGKRVPPVAILKVLDSQGNLVDEYSPPQGEQVIREEHAYLISSILSDNQARTPMFGANSVLNLPFQVAAKTGTSNDFRDNWTIGYTPDLVTGVWIGNADYTPMVNTTGLSGAAPIWSQFMQYAVPLLTNGYPTPFNRPAGIMERVVCRLSGTEPSQWCPDQYIEVFAQDQPPFASDRDLWAEQLIDTWTGYKATSQCNDYTENELIINTEDEWAYKWITEREDGENWALDHGWTRPFYFALKGECDPNTRPNISILYPAEGQVVSSSPLDIYGIIDARGDMEGYSLEIGVGHEPASWDRLIENNTEQVTEPKKIYTLDLGAYPPGELTLRLRIKRSADRYAERIVHFVNEQPTPMPTLTPTPTATPTLTPTPTLAPPPTETPTETPTPGP